MFLCARNVLRVILVLYFESGQNSRNALTRWPDGWAGWVYPGVGRTKKSFHSFYVSGILYSGLVNKIHGKLNFVGWIPMILINFDVKNLIYIRRSGSASILWKTRVLDKFKVSLPLLLLHISSLWWFSHGYGRDLFDFLKLYQQMKIDRVVEDIHSLKKKIVFNFPNSIKIMKYVWKCYSLVKEFIFIEGQWSSLLV